jgi:hypothetical protein
MYIVIKIIALIFPVNFTVYFEGVDLPIHITGYVSSVNDE